MGEIKSTLDLVMEKTKNLRLSEEEKTSVKSNDIKNKIRGLINKYEDNTLRYSEFEKELRRLEKQYGSGCTGFIAEEILQRIDLMSDNGPLIGILKDFCGMEPEPILSTINVFKEKALTDADQRRHAILGLLKKEHQISGSAVVPNLENDEALKKTLKALQIEFANRLASLGNFPSA